jgi:hypothetical protein
LNRKIEILLQLLDCLLLKMYRAIRLFFLLVLVLPPSAFAQERTCPAGFNDFPAMPSHFDQANVVRMPLEKVFAAGQQIFVTNFNACDGAGRPATSGTGIPRPPDPAFAPRVTRVSAPDAKSCAGCHAQPQPGGAGDFVANVFVLAQASVPVSKLIKIDEAMRSDRKVGPEGYKGFHRIMTDLQCIRTDDPRLKS